MFRAFRGDDVLPFCSLFPFVLSASSVVPHSGLAGIVRSSRPFVVEVETPGVLMDTCVMTTVVADEQQRIRVPECHPGDAFEVRLEGEWRIILTRVGPYAAPAAVKIAKKNGFSVGSVDHPVSEEVIRRALNDFP